MITIKDIARDLGLSPATVARALSGAAHTRPETRARVLAAASRLGYIANDAARMMRGQTQRVVGLIVPDIVNSFYATMAEAMAELCEEADHRLVLAVTKDDPVREAAQIRALVAARAAAVALVPTRAPAAATAALARRQPFAQLIRRAERLDGDWFGIDEAGALQAATAHLVGLGHRRILLVCGHATYSTGGGRLAGYRRALAEAGLPFDPALVREGRPDIGHGRTALAHRPAGVTAAIAAGVHLTAGMIEAIEAEGLAVPRDLSVVGFGDAPWQRWWRGGMTRMALPIREIVLNCGAHLVRRVRAQGPAEAGRPAAIAVAHSATLLAGATTGPPAAAET